MAHIPRALVVEDDARMRRIVAKVLTGCGIIVRAAGDGVEALNAFRATREEPELVCADIRMPNMDGREFARRLRREGVDVPIIFVSGTIAKSQEGYREKSHVYLVAKPFSPTELAEIVKQMLAKPRPRLGPRLEAEPVASASELPPLPAPARESTPGYSHADFPDKGKSASITVPQAPDRPFGGTTRTAPSREPGEAGSQPEPQPQPPAQEPSAAQTGTGAHRKRSPHETTMIFLKPISAVEVPSAGPSPLQPKMDPMPVPVPVPAKPPVAPIRAAVEHFVNVERRIRESGPAALRKPGDWVPRLIVWPESSSPEMQRHWCGVVAAALAAVQTAESLEAYAFAPMAKPDQAGMRWRARRGVQVDGALFQAVLERRLHGLFLLCPRNVSPGAIEPFLKEKHLDRDNVLTLGAALADLDCTGTAAVMDVTFTRDEPAFLHALSDACCANGCAMRRSDWRPA